MVTYLNPEKTKIILEKASVWSEKHEKNTYTIEPNSYLYVLIVKDRTANFLLLDHWGATYNPNSVYEVRINGFPIYKDVEPIQSDDEHVKLFDFSYAFFVEFIIYNLDTVSHVYSLDYYVKEYIVT